MSFMKKLTVCLSSLEWHRLRNKSFGSISGISEECASLSFDPVTAEVAPRRRAKVCCCTELIKTTYYSSADQLLAPYINTAPGIFRWTLASHLTRSSFKNGKQKTKSGLLWHRTPRNETKWVLGLFFKKIFVHLPVNRFPLSSFRVEMKTKSFDVYLNIIV